MIKNVHTAIWLDTRRQLKDGTFPVKLRITYQKRRKYYGLPYSFTPQDFKKITGSKARGQYKDLKLELSLIEQKAKDIIKGLPAFTFREFEVRFLMKQAGKLSSYFDSKINELTEAGRIETATSYRSTKQSLINFFHKDKLRFDDITPDTLRKYEAWMLSQGKSSTTIGIYMRNIRHLFNLALQNGENIVYPFGRGLYQIPEPVNIKKALSITDIARIFNYKPEEGSPEHFYRDLWLFSYLCAGINMKDIALLKYENIDGEFIHFRRAKTEGTRRNSRPIDIYLSDEARAIIERWGVKPEYPDAFIFPILKGKPTPRDIQNKVRQVVKLTNKYIRRIAAKTGIDEDITTYTARHSFATVLKRSGVSIEFISEMLGHASVKTTAAYLDSFEDKAKKEVIKKLIDFKNENTGL